MRVRYYLRVVATRPYRPNLVEEKELWIIKKDKEPQGCRPIRMEVGVEDCLQIEFRFDKDTYSLTDVITGSIHFILARIHILHMDIEIIRKEIVGSGDKELIESEVVAKYEIMDGLPVKDEVIPVRMYLRPYDLSPSFKNVDKLFSLKVVLSMLCECSTISIWFSWIRKRGDSSSSKKLLCGGLPNRLSNLFVDWLFVCHIVCLPKGVVMIGTALWVLLP